MPASPNFPNLPSNWKEQLVSLDDGTLSLRIWFNPSGAQGRGLYLVHGFGEQSDRYRHFPHYLSTSVDAIAAIDLPGHGLSKGLRGHGEKFSDFNRAALLGFEAFQNWLREHDLSLPLHWFGHSFGGLTTLSALSDRPDLPLRSMIVSAPLLDLSLPVPAVKKFLGELIEPILPRLGLANEIQGSQLSRDPSVGEAYKADPLNHSKITPRMFKVMTQEMTRLREWTGPLHYSTLFCLPMHDEVVSFPEAFRLAKKWPVATGKKKEIVTWPGASHESFNDWIKAPVFNALDTWLRYHSPF